MTEGRLVLLRHGETEWSRSGRHTGRTDVGLTDRGRSAAAAVQPLLVPWRFKRVLISPLQRAQQTAALAGLTGETDEALLEWDYGGFEGRTTADIRMETGDPTWSIWTAVIPPGDTPGEQVADVGDRADRVLAALQRQLAAGSDCALVAHGHFLRILTARWLGLSAADGRLFALDPGCVSSLGHEHETRVIRSWNVSPTPIAHRSAEG
jgi:broad specificity phosphatase PhoE